MDDANAGPPSPQELEPRLPTEADLVSLCRNLNQQQAKDAPDLYFLLRRFEAAGEKPPEVS